jgi:hypothetical protein
VFHPCFIRGQISRTFNGNRFAQKWKNIFQASAGSRGSEFGLSRLSTSETGNLAVR